MTERKTMWAVLTHKHKNSGFAFILDSTLRGTQKDSIEALKNEANITWESAQELGYVCEKVLVTIETVKK